MIPDKTGGAGIGSFKKPNTIPAMAPVNKLNKISFILFFLNSTLIHAIVGNN